MGIKRRSLALLLSIHQDFSSQQSQSTPPIAQLFSHPPTPGLYRIFRGSFSAIHAREGQLSGESVDSGE